MDYVSFPQRQMVKERLVQVLGLKFSTATMEKLVETSAKVEEQTYQQSQGVLKGYLASVNAFIKAQGGSDVISFVDGGGQVVHKNKRRKKQKQELPTAKATLVPVPAPTPATATTSSMSATNTTATIIQPEPQPAAANSRGDLPRRQEYVQMVIKRINQFSSQQVDKRNEGVKLLDIIKNNAYTNVVELEMKIRSFLRTSSSNSAAGKKNLATIADIITRLPSDARQRLYAGISQTTAQGVYHQREVAAKAKPKLKLRLKRPRALDANEEKEGKEKDQGKIATAAVEGGPPVTTDSLRVVVEGTLLKYAITARKKRPILVQFPVDSSYIIVDGSNIDVEPSNARNFMNIVEQKSSN